MKVTERTSIRRVALAFGRALAERGIRAVLTGGACASIHSGGRSCRDRLAAFYHWNDRQSLGVALEIARRQQVELALGLDCE